MYLISSASMSSSLCSMVVVEEGKEFFSCEVETERKLPMDSASVIISSSDTILATNFKNIYWFRLFRITANSEHSVEGSLNPSRRDFSLFSLRMSWAFFLSLMKVSLIYSSLLICLMSSCEFLFLLDLRRLS